MRVLALIVLLAAAGCVAPGAVEPSLTTPEPAPLSFDALFEIEHDHEDPAFHAARWNAEMLGHLQPVMDGVGWFTMGELDLMGDLLLVGVNAGQEDEGPSEGGFLVLDVADPTAPKLVHYERSPDDASCIGDVKAGPGETQVTLATQCTRSSSPTSQGRGFVVYDLADPAAPTLVTMAPDGTGCHMVDVAVVDGESYVYCAALAGAQAWRLADTPLGVRPIPVNLNLATELTMLRHAPMALGEFGPFGAAFFTGPHDMTTQPDPLTGEPIVIVSHSYAGVRILDGADPTLGRVLGTWSGEGADSFSWIHTAQAIEMDGKRIVVAITENVVNTPPRFWVIDFTDYANPVVLSEHHLAGQDDSQDLVFSLHNFQLVGTRMYIGTYHSGAWVLDLADPTAPVEVAYALSGQAVDRKADGSFFGIGNNWAEQVWDVVVKDGYVLASDMASGLHVYAIAGDPIGDVDHRSFG